MINVFEILLVYNPQMRSVMMLFARQIYSQPCLSRVPIDQSLFQATQDLLLDLQM